MYTLLTQFLSQLELCDDGIIRLTGATVHVPNPSSLDVREDHRMALIECVYKYFYTHPDGHIGTAFTLEPEDKGLLRTFACIGNAPNKGQSGWIVEDIMTDGSIIASRYSEMQKFWPGQYLVESDCIPVRKGVFVSSATHRVQSRSQQLGFFFFFSHKSLDLSEMAQMVRIYWNVRLDCVEGLTRCIVDNLNGSEIIFQLKVCTRACDYTRRDSAVLFLPRRMFRVASLSLAPMLPYLSACLDASEPAFTRRLAPGIGLAEDPGIPSQSFGSSRCEIVADCILAASASGRIDLVNFKDNFIAAIEARSLNLETLFLNPKSEDVYDVSTLWN